jgi:hypothetical protein
MAKKVDTWWDIWLPEEEKELTEQYLLDAIDRSSLDTFDYSCLRSLPTMWANPHNPWTNELRRIGSENVNSKISSGIDLGYNTVEGVIPFIVSESIEKDKAYLIDFSKLYTCDKPFRIK